MQSRPELSLVLSPMISYLIQCHRHSKRSLFLSFNSIYRCFTDTSKSFRNQRSFFKNKIRYKIFQKIMIIENIKQKVEGRFSTIFNISGPFKLVLMHSNHGNYLLIFELRIYIIMVSTTSTLGEDPFARIYLSKLSRLLVWDLRFKLISHHLHAVR